MHITKWKKSNWNGYTLYDSHYMTMQKRQNYGDNKRTSGCQGRGVGMNRWCLESTQCSQAIPCETTTMSAHRDPPCKPMQCTPPRVSPRVSWGLRMAMMWQCSLTHYTKGATVVADVDRGGRKLWMFGGRRCVGNSRSFLILLGTYSCS